MKVIVGWLFRSRCGEKRWGFGLNLRSFNRWVWRKKEELGE